MDTLIGETLRMAIIHSGCTKPVCDQVRLDCYLQSLRNEDQQSVRKEKSETSFWLGNGKVFKSIKRVILPTFIANKNVLLSTEVIENDIPLLLSKKAIKKAKTYIDFSKDKIIFFDEEAPVKFSTSGHYCITVGKINKENENILVQETIVCFSDDWKNKDRNKKRNIALKLHCQFSHPNTQKLISLLKDASVDDKQLIAIINDVSDNCEMF